MSDIREPIERWVDVTGLHCPLPVIRCRATLAKMAEGDMLTLLATDRDARHEITGLVGKFGHQLIAVHERADAVEFVIRKRTPAHGTRVRVSRASNGWTWQGEVLAGLAPAC